MVTPLIKKGTESVSIHLNKWLLQFSANRYTEFVEHVVCLLASVLSEKSRSATKTSGVNSIKNKSSGLQREHERVLSGLRPTVFIHMRSSHEVWGAAICKMSEIQFPCFGSPSSCISEIAPVTQAKFLLEEYLKCSGILYIGDDTEIPLSSSSKFPCFFCWFLTGEGLRHFLPLASILRKKQDWGRPSDTH